MRFFTISGSNFIPWLKGKVQVCAHRVPVSPPSSLTDFLQIYGRRIIICTPGSVKLENRLERTHQKQYQRVSVLKDSGLKLIKQVILLPPPHSAGSQCVLSSQTHAMDLNTSTHTCARAHATKKLLGEWGNDVFLQSVFK